MYNRFGKAFYFVSILAFIFFLLYFYSALPEQVGFTFSATGDLERIWEKGTFFYLMIGAFLLLNAAILFYPKSLETKSNQKLHRAFPLGDPYRDYILAWFYSFGGIVNFTLSILVIYVHSINNQEELATSDFSFWFYLLPSLMVVWVIGLFILFMGKFKAVQRN